MNGLQLAELSDLALDPLLLDLQLAPGVVGPDLRRLEGLLGALAGSLGLDLELQGPPGQLLVPLAERLLGLTIQVLHPAILGVQVTLGFGLEGDRGGGGLPQGPEVVQHLPDRLLEHGERHLGLGLAQDGVEDRLEEASDAREHSGLRGEPRG